MDTESNIGEALTNLVGVIKSPPEHVDIGTMEDNTNIPATAAALDSPSKSLKGIDWSVLSNVVHTSPSETGNLSPTTDAEIPNNPLAGLFPQLRELQDKIEHAGPYQPSKTVNPAAALAEAAERAARAEAAPKAAPQQSSAPDFTLLSLEVEQSMQQTQRQGQPREPPTMPPTQQPMAPPPVPKQAVHINPPLVPQHVPISAPGPRAPVPITHPRPPSTMPPPQAPKPVPPSHSPAVRPTPPPRPMRPQPFPSGSALRDQKPARSFPPPKSSASTHPRNVPNSSQTQTPQRTPAGGDTSGNTANKAAPGTLTTPPPKALPSTKGNNGPRSSYSPGSNAIPPSTPVPGHPEAGAKAGPRAYAPQTKQVTPAHENGRIVPKKPTPSPPKPVPANPRAVMAAQNRYSGTQAGASSYAERDRMLSESQRRPAPPNPVKPPSSNRKAPVSTPHEMPSRPSPRVQQPSKGDGKSDSKRTVLPEDAYHKHRLKKQPPERHPEQRKVHAKRKMQEVAGYDSPGQGYCGSPYSDSMRKQDKHKRHRVSPNVSSSPSLRDEAPIQAKDVRREQSPGKKRHRGSRPDMDAPHDSAGRRVKVTGGNRPQGVQVEMHECEAQTDEAEVRTSATQTKAVWARTSGCQTDVQGVNSRLLTGGQGSLGSEEVPDSMSECMTKAMLALETISCVVALAKGARKKKVESLRQQLMAACIEVVSGVRENGGREPDITASRGEVDRAGSPGSEFDSEVEKEVDAVLGSPDDSGDEGLGITSGDDRDDRGSSPDEWEGDPVAVSELEYQRGGEILEAETHGCAVHDDADSDDEVMLDSHWKSGGGQYTDSRNVDSASEEDEDNQGARGVGQSDMSSLGSGASEEQVAVSEVSIHEQNKNRILQRLARMLPNANMEVVTVSRIVKRLALDLRIDMEKYIQYVRRWVDLYITDKAGFAALLSGIQAGDDRVDNDVRNADRWGNRGNSGREGHTSYSAGHKKPSMAANAKSRPGAAKQFFRGIEDARPLGSGTRNIVDRLNGGGPNRKKKSGDVGLYVPKKPAKERLRATLTSEQLEEAKAAANAAIGR